MIRIKNEFSIVTTHLLVDTFRAGDLLAFLARLAAAVFFDADLARFLPRLFDADRFLEADRRFDRLRFLETDLFFDADRRFDALRFFEADRLLDTRRLETDLFFETERLTERLDLDADRFFDADLFRETDLALDVNCFFEADLALDLALRLAKIMKNNFNDCKCILIEVRSVNVLCVYDCLNTLTKNGVST